MAAISGDEAFYRERSGWRTHLHGRVTNGTIVSRTVRDMRMSAAS